jgi:uncharacterized membrane protein YtjA (UPF0391 family)
MRQSASRCGFALRNDPLEAGSVAKAGAWCFRVPTKEDNIMLKWALIFAIVALIAGALGFTGVAGAAATVAKVLFFIFLVVFLVLLIAGLAAGRKATSAVDRTTTTTDPRL